MDQTEPLQIVLNAYLFPSLVLVAILYYVRKSGTSFVRRRNSEA